MKKVLRDKNHFGSRTTKLRKDQRTLYETHPSLISFKTPDRNRNNLYIKIIHLL